MGKSNSQSNEFMLTKKDYLIMRSRVFKRRKMIKSAEEGLLITPDSQFYTVANANEMNARKYKNKPAILFEDRVYTYTEYNDWCNRYANYFYNEVGLRKGDVAIVYLINRPEILFTIYGLAKIGVISSLINTKQREQPLIHSITHAPGKVFIIGEELIEAFEDVRPRLELDENQSNQLYFVPDMGDISPPSGFKNLFDLVKNYNSSNPPTTAELQAGDPYAYIFTSGTTGLPKAAIITQGHTVGASLYWGDQVMGMKPDDIFYIITPLFHSHAINVCYAAALRHGSTMAIARRFSVSRFWDEAIKYKATCFGYIGEICRYLYNQPPKSTDKKHYIKKVVGNGLRNEMWLQFKERFGIKQIYEFYGATERFCPNFANRFNRDCTVGFCGAPYTIVKYDIDNDEPIRDENGCMIKAEVGEPGLLLGEIADPSLFYMYTDKQADEKKIFRNVFEEGDMFLNTGDLLREIGYQHAQFVDRLGDTFRWKGENVSTEEVESVINKFNQVEMCSVYGVTIPNTEGRAGMASIVLDIQKPDDFDFDGFLNLLKRYLPEYAIPKFIRFKKELEKTATLKIQKGTLKKEGYDVNLVNDALYILLPGKAEYIPLTEEIYDNMEKATYSF